MAIWVKNRWLLIYQVCAHNVLQNIINAEFKWYKYFVNEVETQWKEKPLWGSQTQQIHY